VIAPLLGLDREADEKSVSDSESSSTLISTLALSDLVILPIRLVLLVLLPAETWPVIEGAGMTVPLATVGPANGVVNALPPAALGVLFVWAVLVVMTGALVLPVVMSDVVGRVIVCVTWDDAALPCCVGGGVI